MRATLAASAQRTGAGALHAELQAILGSAQDDAVAMAVVGDAESEAAQVGGGDSTDSESASGPSKQTSDSDGAVAASSIPVRSGGAKKRRSTHALRKEETSALLEEMEALQLRVQTLEAQAEASSDRHLLAAQFQGAILHESVRSQQLSLATAQSVVSGFLNGEHTSPLSTGIRLGSDWNERRAHLLALKDRKIAHATEYVAARSRFLNPLKPHTSDERFENERGDYSCTRYDAVQFENVVSVRQVYDAYLTYLLHIEISVSEQLGHITVRDDFDVIDDHLASYRFITKEDGVPIETHGAIFFHYFESHELANGGPCGVVMIDCVEDDALYPYTPNEAVRKDIVSMVVLIPHIKPLRDEQQPDKLVVTLNCGKYIKLHHSQCPLATPEAVRSIRKNITDWGDVMLKSVQDILQLQAKLSRTYDF